MITLTTLFLHAHLNHYSQQTWFPNAELKGDYLFVDAAPDALVFVTKQYLPKFRELLPALEIRPSLKPAKTAKVQGRAFKAAFYERQKQGDFL